jgi:hypothetical protein
MFAALTFGMGTQKAADVSNVKGRKLTPKP